MMIFNINALYTQLFSGHTPSWEVLQTRHDSQEALFPSEIDFACQAPDPTIKRIMSLALKILILPWGLYEGVRYLVARAIMRRVYPAQTMHSREHLDSLRQQILAEEGRITRHVVLEKNGVRYSGILSTKAGTTGSRKWVLHAAGNQSSAELAFTSSANLIATYMSQNYNILLVNGPGVGRSESFATAERLGDAQQVGISYLETALKANRIILSGHSLGGAAIGRAILQHTFKADIHYFVIRTMTFSWLSHIVEKLSGRFFKTLIHWSGQEMDNVAASRKLQQLRIHELVIKGEKDEMMAGVHLHDSLQEEANQEHRTLHLEVGAAHNDDALEAILRGIRSFESAS